MWEQTERSPALAAPGSNNHSGLIARSTIDTNGSKASNFQGDDDANDLCERYLPLAYKTAGKYQGRGINVDELRSAALAGLFDASRNYDPQRGPFGPYARYWIKGEITALFKEAKRHRAESLDAPIVDGRTGEETETTRFDLLIEESIDGVPALLPDLSELTPKERTVIEARAADRTLQAVGKELGGLSAERVRQIETKAAKKLRKGAIARACISDLLKRRGYQKPSHRLINKFRAEARFKEYGPFKQIKITKHLSGAEKQRWATLLRNAEETDWGRKTVGYEKRLTRAVDGVNGPCVSWKRLRETCGPSAEKIARCTTPEEQLREHLSRHQLERFLFHLHPKLLSGIKVKKPRKGPWCNKHARVQTPYEAKPVIELECHRNDGLRQLNGVPDSYEPNQSKQLRHHRAHAAPLAALRGNAPIRNARGPYGGPIIHGWGPL